MPTTDRCQNQAPFAAAAATDDIDAACRRALGFLELGMPEDAIAEIDELSVSSSLALHLRVDALYRLKNREEASAICLPMTKQEPGDPSWWIQVAYCSLIFGPTSSMRLRQTRRLSDFSDWRTSDGS